MSWKPVPSRLVEAQAPVKEMSSYPGWHQVFPMEVEQRGPLRASMILRYSHGTKDVLPLGGPLRRFFCPWDGLPLFIPTQVHGYEILRADREHCLPLRPSCDGVLLQQRGIRVALRYADCFPVLLWGMDPEPWMLGLHSGFKGILRNISGRGVRLLEESFGLDIRSSCNAWIGPGICPDCYVRAGSDPFVAEMKAFFPGGCWAEGPDGVHPDLGKAIATQLSDAGIPSGNITRLQICSSCDHSVCYSYRRGDLLPRMWLFFEILNFSPIGQKNDH